MAIPDPDDYYPYMPIGRITPLNYRHWWDYTGGDMDATQKHMREEYPALLARLVEVERRIAKHLKAHKAKAKA